MAIRTFRQASMVLNNAGAYRKTCKGLKEEEEERVRNKNHYIARIFRKSVTRKQSLTKKKTNQEGNEFEWEAWLVFGFSNSWHSPYLVARLSGGPLDVIMRHSRQ